MSETIARIEVLLARAAELRGRAEDQHQLLEIFAEIGLLKARYNRESASRRRQPQSHEWRAEEDVPKSLNTH
jgi:hypothetical protein